MILILKHIAIEGPGTIGDFFDNTSWDVKIVDLEKGDRLPKDLSELEGVIVLGGPMNVYEEDKHPFLKGEEVFLRDVIKNDIPTLGICLGAQLLAKARGAQVEKAKEKEIGWYRVKLTDSGQGDPLFKGLDKEFDVFQWHEDAFEIPKGAKLLATSDKCKNQAFRIGKKVYGIQFHVEVTGKMIGDWIDEYLKSSDKESRLKARQMIIDYYKLKEELNKQASKLYLNFSRIIESNKVAA